MIEDEGIEEEELEREDIEEETDEEELEGEELQAYIDEENVRILRERGAMETGRVTEVVDIEGTDNYCRVTFAVQTFEGAAETFAYLKKDAKYHVNSAHYIRLDKEDKDRCMVL